MAQTILQAWQAAPHTNRIATIIPDGCRDLIMRCTPGKRPHWFLSDLQDHTYTVPIGSGVVIKGFRLQPGVRIDEAGLLASVQHRHLDFTDTCCRISSFSRRSALVAEALDHLASDVVSVAGAARNLAVSQRSLQRLLIGQTGRPPAYWMMLARLRKCARAALEPFPLAQIAAMHGYADQAHMSRDFKRWLGTTPSRLRHDSQRRDQLNAPGYA